MKQIADRFVSDRISADLSELPSRKGGMAAQERWAFNADSDAVYILSKKAVQSISSPALGILRWKCRGVCFDHVDEPITTRRTSGADLHLACSYGQLDEFSSNPTMADNSRLLLHAADVRIFQNTSAQHKVFRPVYVGDVRNTVLPDQSIFPMDVFEARTTEQFSDVLAALPTYNFHYAMRKDRDFEAASSKPFVKGFTAAAMGAVILTQKSTNDAAHFLGEDYPYFCLDDGNPTEVCLRARDEFMGPIWSIAKDHMRSMAAKSHPEVIALQLVDIVAELQDGRG